MESPLVSPETLARWIADGRSDLRIIDVRWYLGQPRGSGRVAYARGHIPTAIHLDLDTDLVSPEGPGRHPLPDPKVFAATLAANGIGDGDLVVAYDDVGGWVAARLWWMLEDLGFGVGGHRGARVLDGGLGAWLAGGRPMTTSVPASARAAGPTTPHLASSVPAALHLANSWRRVLDRPGLRSRLGEVLLIDARGGPRYRGEVEPIDPVPGHIPTALSAPTDINLTQGGQFREPNELAARYGTLRNEAGRAGLAAAALPDSIVVVSCGSGVSACHTALAMRVAGLPDPILYPGSYSDWSTAGEPVAVGPEPGQPPPSSGISTD